MEFITYEQFGAYGDGIHDDMKAIAKAHAAANLEGKNVRAKEGAKYYIKDDTVTAEVMTSTDWTGAEFIIDDTECVNIGAPVFAVKQADNQDISLDIKSLERGQDFIDNPAGRTLYVTIKNANHMDYIRRGGNMNNGTARTDAFVVEPDGKLRSPVAFDFTEVTQIRVKVIPEDKLTIRGGSFTTIANRQESFYRYHARNIAVTRSNTEICGFSHYVTGELDHGAPYGGFLSISGCADIDVHDCLFTGHFIYYTMGTGGVTVPMGSYDINCGEAANITFRRCTQTTDIMGRKYWGLIGTNFCRDLTFEDCEMSRFDAHMGVTNCTIIRCRLGWQCLNAIGHGTFTIEDTEAYGYAFVNLRDDYGCSFRGDMIIRRCKWHPLGNMRSIFRAHNDGTHEFGYDCYLPQNITIDGFSVVTDGGEEPVLYVFNDWRGKPEGKVKYPMVLPRKVEVNGITGAEKCVLCEADDALDRTEFIIG